MDVEIYSSFCWGALKIIFLIILLYNEFKIQMVCLFLFLFFFSIGITFDCVVTFCQVNEKYFLFQKGCLSAISWLKLLFHFFNKCHLLFLFINVFITMVSFQLLVLKFQ